MRIVAGDKLVKGSIKGDLAAKQHDDARPQPTQQLRVVRHHDAGSLFDATIVRVEAAGTLPPTATVEASEANDRADEADPMDHITHGDLDV